MPKYRSRVHKRSARSKFMKNLQIARHNASVKREGDSELLESTEGARNEDAIENLPEFVRVPKTEDIDNDIDYVNLASDGPEQDGTSRDTTEDEDLLFFRALLPDFKKLNENRKRDLKAKFVTLLNEELDQAETQKYSSNREYVPLNALEEKQEIFDSPSALEQSIEIKQEDVKELCL